MDQPSECQLTPEKLPKSVKVRSTCNACQQAKIRCSHERPSCRRCQRHKIDCIYSISRRLGRPAKKRDNISENPAPGQDTREHASNQANKRIRSPKKKKVKDEPMSEMAAIENQHDHEESFKIDEMSFGAGLMEKISIEEPNQQTSTFMDMASAAPFSAADTIDLTSDSWLQEFMSNPFTELTQEPNLPDAPEAGTTKDGDLNASLHMDLKDLAASAESLSGSASDTRDQPSSSYYPVVSSCFASTESVPGTSQAVNIEGTSTYSEYLRKESLVWSQPLSALVEEFPPEPSSLFPQTKPAKRSCEYGFPVDDFRVSAGTAMASNCQCQSHEQAVRDLIRVNICASRTSPSIAIDSILTCQRVLQQLAEMILQCRVCSRTRVNLLMVVVVSIDSLVTTLDAITSVESDIADRVFPEYPNQLLQDYRLDATLASHHTRRYKGNSAQFRMQLDACPLIIGGFCVPSEEKFSFVKRVLHARLSGLLSTVRRIRRCTQEVLAASASRGRLVMMMETDRRLQLIMMKMKMLTRPGSG